MHLLTYGPVDLGEMAWIGSIFSQRRYKLYTFALCDLSIVYYAVM